MMQEQLKLLEKHALKGLKVHCGSYRSNLKDPKPAKQAARPQSNRNQNVLKEEDFPTLSSAKQNWQPKQKQPGNFNFQYRK